MKKKIFLTGWALAVFASLSSVIGSAMAASGLDPALGLDIGRATGGYGAPCTYPLRILVTPAGVLGFAAFIAVVNFLVKAMQGREIVFLKKLGGESRAKTILVALFSWLLSFGMLCFFAAVVFWFDLARYYFFDSTVSGILFGVASLITFALALVAPATIVSINNGEKIFFSVLKYEALLGILLVLVGVPVSRLLADTAQYGCRVYGI